MHDRAWIAERTKKGGTIGYAQSSFDDDTDRTVRDFKTVATKLCRGKSWVVVREIIPAPASGVSTIRNAASGDASGAASSAGQTLMHDRLYRSRTVNKDVKVEYGSPLNSWNQAEIRCKRS